MSEQERGRVLRYEVAEKMMQITAAAGAIAALTGFLTIVLGQPDVGNNILKTAMISYVIALLFWIYQRSPRGDKYA